MPPTSTVSTDSATGHRVLTLEGLQALVDVLEQDGFEVIGPVVRDGAIGYGPVTRVADLPVGWGDEQDAGSYRLRRRDDEMVFGYASGAQSAKPVFFPARDLFWRAHREDDGFVVEEPPAPEGPFALLGVRSCDLSALGIHDTVLLGRGHIDPSYAVRRADAFVVAVTCSDPGGTCFCVSMGTGPRPRPGQGAAYDLSLTEILDDDGHRFLVEVVSDRGAEVMDRVGADTAGAEDRDAADAVAESAAARMGRTLDTAGLKELLYASADSPMWNEVATRCLSCTNCTLVCPTCFCTDVQDVSDLAGDDIGRERIWDSCFDLQHSYLHGGSVRRTTPARYRQWMTHKLASWIDQFGTSGCVGCGRCITWCPVGIDITAQAAVLREGQ
ncbi:MAG: 4Fe-4S dicluster domain-containing protein [Nocardioides sp.]